MIDFGISQLIVGQKYHILLLALSLCMLNAFISAVLPCVHRFKKMLIEEKRLVIYFGDVKTMLLSDPFKINKYLTYFINIYIYKD